MASVARDIPGYDHWLERFPDLPTLTGRRALDVGCGPGIDTQVLTSWGFAVTACDVSPDALATSGQRNPSARHVLADARTLAPLASESFDLVVASLSLHYFDFADSHRAFSSVHRVLAAGGRFVFRVNAWDDYEFGASANAPPWELVRYRNQTKQFFTEEMLREVLLTRFQILSLEKGSTDRYVKRKSCFVGRARKLPD